MFGGSTAARRWVFKKVGFHSIEPTAPLRLLYLSRMHHTHLAFDRTISTVSPTFISCDCEAYSEAALLFDNCVSLLCLETCAHYDGVNVGLDRTIEAVGLAVFSTNAGFMQVQLLGGRK